MVLNVVVVLDEGRHGMMMMAHRLMLNWSSKVRKKNETTKSWEKENEKEGEQEKQQTQYQFIHTSKKRFS